MVQPRWKVVLYFAIFVVPALALYALFFLYPFAQGIRISFTNWDGLTPRIPISLPRQEFESKILDRVSGPNDRAYLLSVYHLDPDDNQYKRYAATGLTRYRLQHLMRVAGYEPEGYKTVGLANYVKIFTGGVEERFYPHVFTQVNYNADSDLPASIPKGEFEKGFLSKLSRPEDRDLALEFYAPGPDKYSLKPRYDELTLEDRIWLLPEIDREKRVSSEQVDQLISSVKSAGLSGDRAALDAAIRTFPLGRLSAGSTGEVKAAAEEIFRLGALRKILAATWVRQRFDMGVVGFTLFFTFFNVLLSNLLGFLLALALDTGIRSQKVLRSVFFLPNVLSMIVVALVWSFVFFNLLPALTGIDKWMGDPAKAPWLIVLVQVWQQAGYLMVIYLAGLSNIPTDVLEAASIDGTGYRARLRHITLPLLVPALTICLFLSLSNSLKSFDLMYAMVGPSGYALGTIPFVMDIFFDAFAKKLAGLATAKALLLFAAIALITGVQLAISKRREVQL
ncbi:MAG TPA: sugar ABC transporter permease [Spirochaetia bacterium]|nr:sugar ABC transporter permease [Spirochaetia bacterium]